MVQTAAKTVYELNGPNLDLRGNRANETCDHDALTSANIPTVEVQTSNAHQRDSLCHHSFAADAAIASLCGFGIEGYRLAFSGLAAKIGATA